MKIGIFTFHCAVNYGAVLQTYCLQEVLKSMGHEVFVIDYRPKYLIDPYKVFVYNSRSCVSYLAKCKGLLRACLVAPIRWKRNRAFSKFIDCYLNLYQLDLNDESNDFEAFIFGSDQIWNPKITHGFDRVYLGDFPAAKGKKLISYAASAGSISNFSGENIDYFLSRLQCFDKITVREESLADYINSKLPITSEVVFDPVLLAGRHVLEILFDKNKKISSSYLLLFQIGRNDKISNYAIRLAKAKNFKIVDIITSSESLFNLNIKQTLSLNELLLSFKNASYVVTSSFHGTVFAILFNKQFNTISVNDSIDERALSLLKELHLSDRMLHIENEPLSSLIDYDAINDLYTRRKIASYNILNNSFECH